MFRIYSVLLVDDEPWALKVMETAFPWAENGFRVVGRCLTVPEAIGFIQKSPPDVMLTDIRISGESGLKIIAACQSLALSTVCVVVTAFPDFAVAKASIKLKIFDFLLKPIDIDEAALLVQRLHEHLAASSPRDFRTMARYIPQDPFKSRVRVAAASGNVRRPHGGLLTQDRLIASADGMDYYILDDAPELEYTLVQQAEQTGISIGLSAPGTAQTPSAELLRQAEAAAYGSFLFMRHTAYFAVAHTPAKTSAALSLIQSADATANRLYQLMLEQAFGMADLIQLCNMLSQTDGSAFRLPVSRPGELPQRFHNALELCRAILPPAAGTGKYPDARYEQTVLYLHQHMSENLSLRQIAEKLHISASYLSEIFLTASGMNFQHYLILLRNARACELLQFTNLSVKQVAALAGFQDYFHFCKQFKTHYQLTPSQFRETCRSAGGATP